MAAHSTTRALYASYDGPLYQVMRLSDDTLKNIGVFPGRFLRNFNNVVFLAANGGSNPWDTATGWPVDTSWLVVTPLG